MDSHLITNLGQEALEAFFLQNLGGLTFSSSLLFRFSLNKAQIARKKKKCQPFASKFESCAKLKFNFIITYLESITLKSLYTLKENFLQTDGFIWMVEMSSSCTSFFCLGIITFC